MLEPFWFHRGVSFWIHFEPNPFLNDTDLSLGPIWGSFSKYQNNQKIYPKVSPKIDTKIGSNKNAKNKSFSNPPTFRTAPIFVSPTFRTFPPFFFFVHTMKRSAALRELRQRFPSSADLPSSTCQSLLALLISHISYSHSHNLTISYSCILYLITGGGSLRGELICPRPACGNCALSSLCILYLLTYRELTSNPGHL